MIMIKEQVPLHLSLILSFAEIIEPQAILLSVNYKRQALLATKRKPNYFASCKDPVSFTFCTKLLSIKVQWPAAECVCVC